MILSFRTDMPGQIVQSHIRLLGAVWSGSTLFAIPSASFGHITLWYSHIFQILEWLEQIFGVSEYLGNLRYIYVLTWQGLKKTFIHLYIILYYSTFKRMLSY